MRVCFDSDIFVKQRFGGVPRYFTRLATGLSELDVEVTLLGGLYINEYLPDLPSVRGLRVPEIPYTAHIRREISRRWQSRVIRRLSLADLPGKPMLVHKTWYDPDFFDSRVPVVVTVHDMIPELFVRRDDAAAIRKRIVCERATAILADSEHTKTDLLNIYGVSEERVHVVHLGVDFTEVVARPELRVNEPPFLLYVGLRGGYKNFSRLVEAVARSRPLTRSYKVVCCGGGPFNKGELARIASLGLTGSFRQTSPSDRELDDLYRRAHALVIPSLYEGFGLTVLEAMVRGCCIACSNQASLPEVAGDAAVFFSPAEPDSITAALEKICFDDSLRAQLQLRGLARCREFSWARCIIATKRVYEHALALSSGAI